MKILLLTTVEPTQAAIDYRELTDVIDIKNISLISIPFFAEIDSMNNGRLYLPTLFAMYKAMTDKPTQKKIFDKRHTLIIGNSYKSEKFDMIISLGDSSEDTYTKMIRDSQEYKEFNLLVEAEKLYDWQDAELNFPTIRHVILFLEGVIKDGTIQRKAKTSNTM